MSEMDRELYVLTYFFKDCNTRRNIRGKFYFVVISVSCS